MSPFCQRRRRNLALTGNKKKRPISNRQIDLLRDRHTDRRIWSNFAGCLKIYVQPARIDIFSPLLVQNENDIVQSNLPRLHRLLFDEAKKIGRTIGRNIPREKGISLIQFAENENEHKNLSSYYANICGHRRLPPARKLYFIFRKTMIMMLSSSGSQSPPSLVRNLKKNSASAAPFNSIEDRMGKK